MLKEKIAKIIKKSIRELQKEKKLPKLNVSDILVEKPKEKSYGDYSLNIAMRIAKAAKKNPMETAKTIALKIESQNSKIFEKVEVVKPGFINLWIGSKEIEKLFSEFIKNGLKFFQKKPSKKETIVIEYSSPNIAKPLGIHHLRSTIIGQSLVNILRFYGNKVISLSFPGDWGTQFGFLIAAYKKWGDKEKLKKSPIKEMLNLYVRFSKAAKKNLFLIKKGREEFKKLEQGDKENRRLWKWFLEESLKDFQDVYKLLGVEIENTIGESYYESEMKPLIKEALKKGIAQKGEDGAVVVAVPGSSTPEIIQKSDGSTIYATRELAAIRHRFKKWKADKILYVAANQQTFHLKQVFGAAERLGIAVPGQLVHIKFGMMLASGGKKFATREGRLIPLKDVLEEAALRAKKIVNILNPSLNEKTKEEIAKKVGVGAVKFFDLSHNRLADIIFDWDNMLNLKGFSASYIQYTYARLNNILKKARFKKKKNIRVAVVHLLEKEVMAKILSFDEIIKDVAKNYYPNKLAGYLYELAETLNVFYEKLPVLKAENNVKKQSRLNIVFGAKEILKAGLRLLGISAPEKI